MNKENIRLLKQFITQITKWTKQGHDVRIQYNYQPFGLPGVDESNLAVGPGWIVSADWRDDNQKWKECSIYLEEYLDRHE